MCEASVGITSPDLPRDFFLHCGFVEAMPEFFFILSQLFGGAEGVLTNLVAGLMQVIFLL